MTIGIDARFIGRPGGIGRYTEELVWSLSSRATHHTFVLFLRDDGMKRLANFAPPNVRKVRAEVPWYTLAEQIRMPGIIDREQLDLVHFPHWNVPIRTRTPFVLTIHDLIILQHPSLRATTLGPIRYFVKSYGHRLVLRNATRRARRIIVPSEFVRADVCARFPSAASKVVVISEGVRSPPVRSQVSNVNGQMSVLYVGNAYPHKNLERLIQAFLNVRRIIPSATLTIAGYDDYFFRRTEQFVRTHSGGERIQFIPSPEDDTLESLYHQAALFVMPSETEGFGLPPLEAMARGVPVASSRGGSLPEVLGEAAHYFDPERIAEMSKIMEQALTDPVLRERLITKGKEQAARYSWEAAARGTLAIYAEEGNRFANGAQEGIPLRRG